MPKSNLGFKIKFLKDIRNLFECFLLIRDYEIESKEFSWTIFYALNDRLFLEWTRGIIRKK